MLNAKRLEITIRTHYPLTIASCTLEIHSLCSLFARQVSTLETVATQLVTNQTQLHQVAQ